MSDQTSENPKVQKARKRGRKPGCVKTGGRKKGTPNKNSSQLRQALDDTGFNLAEEFIALYRQETDLEKKRSDLHFLFRYVYPALKEIEQIPSSAPSATPPASQASTDSLLSLVKPQSK